MKKILLVIMLLVSPIYSAWAEYLGEFTVGDSIDLDYYCYNCYGSKKAACDSIRWAVMKDTTNGLAAYSLMADSNKVTSTTYPSFYRSLGGTSPRFNLRISANAGNHQKGHYRFVGESWVDTCSTPFEFNWWTRDTTLINLSKKIETDVGACKDTARLALRPTTAWRKLKVAATGEVALDFANVNTNTGNGPPSIGVSFTGSIGSIVDTAWVAMRGQINDMKAKTDSSSYSAGGKINVQVKGMDANTIDSLVIKDNSFTYAKWPTVWWQYAHIGIDWSNISNPTAAEDLSGTVILRSIDIGGDAEAKITTDCENAIVNKGGVIADSVHGANISDHGYTPLDKTVGGSILATQYGLGYGDHWRTYLWPYGRANKTQITVTDSTGDTLSISLPMQSATPGIYDSLDVWYQGW